MEDHFDPRVDVCRRISAIDNNHGSGDEREDIVLDEICGGFRLRDCRIRLGFEFACTGKSVFRGSK